jgi:predicted membrane protein
MFNKLVYSSLAKYISIVFFAGVILLILAYPYAFKGVVGSSKHGYISFLMIGACLAIVHGFGYIPKNKFIKHIIAPYITWSICILCLYFIFF